MNQEQINLDEFILCLDIGFCYRLLFCLKPDIFGFEGSFIDLPELIVETIVIDLV